MRICSIVLFFIITLFLSICKADTIYLKNGNRLVGTIIRKDKEIVVVKVAFGTLTLQRKEIKNIDKDTEVDNIIYQGDRLISMGAYKHGLLYYKRAVRKNPKERLIREAAANAYALAGKHYLKFKRNRIAKICFRIAKKYNPQLDISEVLTYITQKEKGAQKEIEEANQLLREAQTQKALQKYFLILKNFPEYERKIAFNMARAAILEGNKLLNTKANIQMAKFYYNVALERWPKIYPFIEKQWIFVNIHIINKKYLTKQMWDEALLELHKLLKVSPLNKSILFLTGYVYEKLSDRTNAFHFYRKSLGSKTGFTNNLAEVRELSRKASGLYLQTPTPRSVFKDEKFKGKWSVLITKHFKIYHQKKALANKVAKTIEYHWNKILARFAPKGLVYQNWPKDCKVYIFPSKKMYISSTRSPSWSEGVTRFSVSGVMIRGVRIYLYQSAPLLLSSVIPHELTHAIYPWLLNNKMYLPLWLNEGVAVCSEPSFRTKNRLRIFRNAVRSGRNFSLKHLFSLRSYPSNTNKIGIFYAQSYALTKFLLNKYGSRNLLEFAKRLRRSSAVDAISSIYPFSNIRSLENAFFTYYKLTGF